jgi:gas vesicle protein
MRRYMAGVCIGVAGATVGCAVGLVVAPVSGAELRRRMRKQIEHRRRAGERRFGSTRSHVNNWSPDWRRSSGQRDTGCHARRPRRTSLYTSRTVSTGQGAARTTCCVVDPNTRSPSPR